jgi:hypothetical protein
VGLLRLVGWSALLRLIAAVSLVLLGGCIEGVTVPGPASDFIVVSDFTVPEGTVRLDSSFGFSLYRGEPGVPVQQRAASVGRAVAFLVTDTIAERLRALGYDAQSTISAAPQTGYRALLVSGTFRTIDEGSRRRPTEVGSAVIADVQIKAEVPGSGIRPVQSFAVDSRTAPRVGVAASTATRRETGVDADAARVGAQIASVVADIARRNNWVPTMR